MLLLLSVTFNTQQSRYNTKPAKIEEQLKITDELYTVQFKTENTGNNKYNLIIAIDLEVGASFISPFERKELTGKFYMDFGSYDKINFDGNIIETPRAFAVLDRMSFEPIIWVKENTTYTQPLVLLSEGNFEVFGTLKFTIEPRCTLEIFPFAIKYQDGEITIVDAKC